MPAGFCSSSKTFSMETKHKIHETNDDSMLYPFIVIHHMCTSCMAHGDIHIYIYIYIYGGFSFLSLHQSQIDNHRANFCFGILCCLVSRAMPEALPQPYLWLPEFWASKSSLVPNSSHPMSSSTFWGLDRCQKLCLTYIFDSSNSKPLTPHHPSLIMHSGGG